MRVIIQNKYSKKKKKKIVKLVGRTDTMTGRTKVLVFKQREEGDPCTKGQTQRSRKLVNQDQI